MALSLSPQRLAGRPAARGETVTVVDARRYIGLAQTGNAAAVTGAITQDPEWAASLSATGGLAPSEAAATGKVVNTLKIQMHPIELGLVTATLRLHGEELVVSLQVETGEAYRQLLDDKDTIVRALRGLDRVERAARECARLLDLAERRADRYMMGLARHQRGLLLAAEGRPEDARAEWAAAEGWFAPVALAATPFPVSALVERSQALSLDFQELLVALVIEMAGAENDALADGMSAMQETVFQPAMRLAACSLIGPMTVLSFSCISVDSSTPSKTITPSRTKTLRISSRTLSSSLLAPSSAALGLAGVTRRDADVSCCTVPVATGCMNTRLLE